MHLAQLNTCLPNTTNKYIKIKKCLGGTNRDRIQWLAAMTWPGGADLAALWPHLQNQYSETKMWTLTTFRWDTTPPTT